MNKFFTLIFTFLMELIYLQVEISLWKMTIIQCGIHGQAGQFLQVQM